MPIKQENKNRYPKNWKQIREDILKRANNKCEFCGVENKSYIVYENGKKDTIISPNDFMYPQYASMGKFWTCANKDGKICNYRKALVVLTIAHLDHTPENCDYNNLKALCQKCHNSYDAKHRTETRKQSKEDKPKAYEIVCPRCQKHQLCNKSIAHMIGLPFGCGSCINCGQFMAIIYDHEKDAMHTEKGEEYYKGEISNERKEL